MTEIPLYFFCHYRTRPGDWRQTDWDTNKVVKGLKQEPFGGYIDTQSGNRYTSENIEDLIKSLLPRLGRRLNGVIDKPYCLVPIPNSGMAVGASGQFRSPQLARYVAQGCGAGVRVLEALRWSEPRQPAHEQAGRRDPDDYESHFRLTNTPREEKVVLFDDVITSGSQLIAACRFLNSQGIRPAGAIVVAKAVQEQRDPAVGWQREILDYSRPFENWEWDPDVES